MGQDRVNAEHRAHAQAAGPVDHRLYLHRGDASWSEWSTLLAAAAQSGAALDSALAASSVASWWAAALGASIPDSTADRIAAVRASMLM